MTASKRPKNDLDIEHLSEHDRDFILRQAAAIREAQDSSLETQPYDYQSRIHRAGGVAHGGYGQRRADWETLDPSADGQEQDSSYESLPSERWRGRLAVAPDNTSDYDFVSQDPIPKSVVNSVENTSIIGDGMQYGALSHHVPAAPTAFPSENAIQNFSDLDAGDGGLDVGQWSSFYEPNSSHVMCYSGDLEIQRGNDQTAPFHMPATETTLLPIEPTEPTPHHNLYTPSAYLDDSNKTPGFQIITEQYGPSVADFGDTQEISISEKISSDGSNEEYGPTSAASDCRSAHLDSDSWDDMVLTDSQSHLRHKSSNNSDWSLVDSTHSPTRNPHEDLQHIHVSWITSKPSRSGRKFSGGSSGSGSPAGKHRRRQRYHDIRREETRQTRKLKACLRCKMQRVRCVTDTEDPEGICRTCQLVSKQIVHKLPCVRYKLSESVLFRAGGLVFTDRWPVMKISDISVWENNEIRRIEITLGICKEPFAVTVRKFVPELGDSLERSWYDGATRKSIAIEPYAMAKMAAAAVDFQRYIDANAIQCMEHVLAGSDILIQETYAMATRHFKSAQIEDERILMQNLFRLWFAIRHTTGSSWLVGDDTLGMSPELKDHSYPLFGKIPIPPVLLTQFDIIITLNVLQPLRKIVLDHLQRIIAANKPRSWLTIYLCTFILLHNCSMVTADRYRHARKHRLKTRYSLPVLVEGLHHGANVMLAHFHYRTEDFWPFSLDWKNRENHALSELTAEQVRFIIRTSELVKQREDQIRIMKDHELFEDELYFVSQMFEKDWTPRDTISSSSQDKYLNMRAV